MKFFLVSAFVFFSVATSCKSEQKGSDLENVFGSDDREPITSTELPWRAIGRILVGIGRTCTGTLVTKEFVLTAAHCVINPDTKELTKDKITFSPNYIGGQTNESSGVEKVWVGTNDPKAQRRSDWAILKLSKSFAETHRWLGVKNNDVASFPNNLTVVGYSGAFQRGQFAGVHRNCKTMGRDPAQGLIYHDCDATEGSSGGPVLSMIDGILMVVGINVADNGRIVGGGSVPQYRPEYANIAIPSGDAVKKVLEIIGQN